MNFLSQEIIVEKLSGDVLDIEVSALKKLNLDKLEEAIHLTSRYFKFKSKSK